MTIDELIRLRDHADAVVKISGQTFFPSGRFDPPDIQADTVDKAIAFFLSIYPDSPLKRFT